MRHYQEEQYLDTNFIKEALNLQFGISFMMDQQAQLLDHISFEILKQALNLFTRLLESH